MLLLVVMRPRKLLLQPGTELAPRFDEARSSAICRDVIAPQLRGGARGAALVAGFEAIVRRLAEEEVQAPPAPPKTTATAGAISAPMRAATPAHDQDSPLWPLLAVPVGGVGIGGLVWRLRGRYCERCRRRMQRRRETLEPAS